MNRIFFVFILMLTAVLKNTIVEARSVTYIHSDLLGTPIVETDEGGNVIWRDGNTPYGKAIKDSSAASTNTVGFTGHQNDRELGLTYMQARYYDPVIGRFYSNDPIGSIEHLGTENGIHGFNRYAYANNNPYLYVDPTGMCSEQSSSSEVTCKIEDAITNTIEPIIAGVMEAAGVPVVPEGERDPNGDFSHEAESNSVSEELTAIATMAVVAKTGVDIVSETPDNSPDSFTDEGKGKNKISIHKKNGTVMQTNKARHGGKSFNVWKNKKSYKKNSKKRDTSVWADSGKDRGR